MIFTKGVPPMRYALYLFFNLKRCLKRPAMLALLLLFPVFAIMYRSLGADHEQDLCVCVYAEQEDSFCEQLAEKLTQRDGVVTFIRTASEEELYHTVMTGDAECGYVFHAGLLDSLNEGKKKDLVDVVISAETTLRDVTDEIVYAELFEEYSLAILTDYLLQDDVLENPPLSEIEALYRENMTNGSTFAFDYTGAYSSYQGIRSGLSIQVLKGLCSILLLLSGFLGLLNYCVSAEAQVYCAVTKTGRKFLLLAELLPPVLLTTFAAIFSLFFTGAISDGRDLLRLFTYALLVLLFCALLYVVLRKRTIILFLLPFYLLGCLIFTPVFVDISTFIPALRPICLLFLPYYYL